MSQLAMQFDDADQQHHAASLGMWVFLASEIMFFGGLFLAYTVYRHSYASAFATAGEHASLWSGTTMTALLLASSLTIVLAESSLQRGQRGGTIRRLVWTILLGTLFLALKAHEYWTLYNEQLVPGWHFDMGKFPPAAGATEGYELFFCFYFIMTGLHALHMFIGIAAVAVNCWKIGRSSVLSHNKNRLEMTALYWHFVDIVWIFLFPILYLVGAQT